MAAQFNKYAFANQPGKFRHYSELYTPEKCTHYLNDLLETPPEDFGGKDIAVLNLLCAQSLPGSEHLNIPSCLAQLDRLASEVKSGIERSSCRLRSDSEYRHCLPMGQMAMLVTIIKLNYGVKYNPEIIARKRAGNQSLMTNSRDVFLHGVLDENRDRRTGTCGSIPVLIAAVARRLGYPVGLVVAGRHIFNRWDGDGVCFNVEASGPTGMSIQPDDEYRKKIRMEFTTPAEEKSPYFLRTLSPAEEFALFLALRAECLVPAARYDEIPLLSARSLQFSPDDPESLRWARCGADLALKSQQDHSNVIIPSMGLPEPYFFYSKHLLNVKERSFYMTIEAQHDELHGDFHAARARYEEACRQRFEGANEQRDLQRFLTKHNLPRRSGPILPPQSPVKRRLKLTCPPCEEGCALAQLARECEVKGELLKAHDALHDLYLFDPSHSGVFLRARMIEKRPEFQLQLKNAMGNSHQNQQFSKGANYVI